MMTTTNTFSIFPEFERLTLADKETYDSYVKDLPPVDDTSFSTLMAWWNPLDNLSVADLNGNVVATYWMAGDEKHSGLSLIGTNNVDESITAIFDYQRSQGDKPRLVNVSDFVIANIQYPELFKFTEEKKFTEYIYEASRFYPVQSMPFYWRRKVERKLDRVGGVSVVRTLDLNEASYREMVVSAAKEWAPKGVNDLGEMEADALRFHLDHAELLGIKGIGLFIGGKLHGFCIYTMSADQRYLTVKHVKATDKSSLGLEYVAYQFAKYMHEQGVRYINLNSDLGLLHLRMFMLALGPHSFFHKYIVEPR